MVTRRQARTSRSNSRHSRVRSHVAERQASAHSPDSAHRPNAEAVSLAPFEERIRRMEEAQNEILALLRPTLPSVSARGAGAFPDENLQNPVHIRSEIHIREAELHDTASSTHPAPAAKYDARLFLPENDSKPSLEIREEVRRLIREEFPAKERSQFLARRKSQDSSPFVESVRQHPIPTGFKLPTIEAYDGTTDPYEHVDHFRTIMHIQRASDALLCQVFPATLKGQARTWFYSLPIRSVHSFNDFADIFTEQFMANRRIIKDSSHLSGIRQNESETLKEYFQRFSVEARQIPGVDPELLRGVFLGGLRPGPFYSSLMRETVHSYADLVHRVEAQIAADEAISTHRKQFEAPSAKRKNSSNEAPRSSQRKKSDSRPDTSLPPRPPQRQLRPPEDYTPLNTSRVNVLMAIQNKEMLKWPNTLKPNTGNQESYCHFHKSRGHKTEACFHLKEEIERLIRQGYLGQFIQGSIPSSGKDVSTGGQPVQNQQQGNRQFVGEIAMITGGPPPSNKVFSN